MHGQNHIKYVNKRLAFKSSFGHPSLLRRRLPNADVSADLRVGRPDVDGLKSTDLLWWICCITHSDWSKKGTALAVLIVQCLWPALQRAICCMS